ncbi:MAG: hypothetical protein NZ990_02745 [Myxococcota bacterium]|nr:hypothetical protein [Myxococcota bacterium]
MVKILALFLVVFSPVSAALASPAATVKRPVDVAVYVIDISQVQELEQAIVADFLVIARWERPDLADPSAAEIRVLPVDQVDSPRLIVINSRKLREKLSPIAEVGRTGTVLLRQRYQGTLSTPMNLENFPMDRQLFKIEVGTLDHKDRTLVPDEDRSGAMQAFTVAGWAVEEDKMLAGDQLAPDGVNTFATVTAVYAAERNSVFFAWKLFIPLGLIVLMAYTVFWLDPTVLSTQIGIATSTVFTLIAYNFALSSILPQVSYLTRADLYLIGCMLLVFGALGEAVVTGVLARNEARLALARRIDVLARFVYPALFALIALIAFS